MEKFIIEGGKKLCGKVEIQSAKNSILPLVSASIISGGKTRIKRCPKIKDVLVMCEIIREMGGKAEFFNEDLLLDTARINTWELPRKLTGEIRASLFMVGALLCRFNYASMRMPGGCNIGERPIDIHVNSMRKLGVVVSENEDIVFSGNLAKSGEVTLRFPSVGATENLMMCALKLKGRTVIKNCAKEPEIVDLQRYLNLIGGRVKGAGSSVIEIEGVDRFTKDEVSISPSLDRIELGTFLFAGASTGGELEIRAKDIENYRGIIKIFENNACKIYNNSDNIYYIGFSRPMKGFGKIVTGPYPEFPTDLHPQLIACGCSLVGLTAVEERVFPQRFGYVEQLKLLGANVGVYGNLCLASGGALKGTTVSAGDLRGGAALVIAGLFAEGVTEVKNVGHVDRGYYKIEEKLASLGAKIKRVSY